METNNQPSKPSSSAVPKIVGVIVAILVCCSCVLVLGAEAVFYQVMRGNSNLIPTNIATLISPAQNSSTPRPTPEMNRNPVDTKTTETFETLQTTIVPENDPYDLACRLKKICNVSKTVQGKSYQVGDKEKFWILNSDSVSYNQTEATLLYITPHTYFWAQDGVKVNQKDMKALMDAFESKIYPTDREFFGSEWTPGVDNDPHIFVLYAGGLGSNIGGVYNSEDEYNPAVHEHSNAHETYILSSDTTDLADPYSYATLAHEFVHMIQFPTDRNDASWITEGFAEVGSLINGYYSPGADWLYVQTPDIQLNTWADNNSPEFSAHYGQSFLYLAYFLDRFGEKATKALTANPEDDLTSVDDTLKQLNITDPQTGKLITTDDVFMDWAATLYLKDGNVGDGRYTYHNYSEAPKYSPTDAISNCPQTITSDVNQYGIDYYTINCTGDHTIQFTGSTQAKLLPVDPHSGQYAFWSNKGNESDMTLTREFDFTNTTGPIKMSYWTWYDIEKDWDYAHLAASTDGQNWELLKTPSSTDYNPAGASYGWSYTGQSNGWIQEEVDLSQFAGKKVQLRFEYITDAEINGEGFLLDDISVDAVNYKTDFETDDGGWQAAGFVRVDNVLPQTYGLSLIVKGNNTTVTRIPLNPDQTASIPLSLKNGEEAALIVTGTTRFTTYPASYTIEIK
jgi:immune inhibitor A